MINCYIYDKTYWEIYEDFERWQDEQMSEMQEPV